MLGNLNAWEVGVVVVVALLIFGPRKLPEIGKALGTAITEFKQSMSNFGAAGQAKNDQAQPPKKIEENTEEPPKAPPAG